MPINELLNALGARVEIDPLFCLWIRYEDPTADRGSKAAPWLCQPTPVSTMPKSVMPCQVSWQFVETKSQGSVHGCVVEAAAAGGAFVGMSAAHASTAQKAPASPRTIPLQICSFVMRWPRRAEP